MGPPPLTPVFSPWLYEDLPQGRFTYTLVTLYLKFPFLQFQLPLVNHTPEADDSLDV